ncbi:MAG: hypothetical protein ACMXYA_03215 [Candidatus Woesearchaeota archaeon]
MEHIIGSDETLKGDTFGGIVVAGVYLDQSQKTYLEKLGITDSKKITDTKINKLAPIIMQHSTYAVKNIFPVEYNTHKLTPLLNTLHLAVKEEIMQKITDKKFTHVVDKFPGCVTGDIIVEKAESKYIEVAAASIIARHVGLQQLVQLSNTIGFTIPKGSTHVSEALEKLSSSSYDPKLFVKLHFKNVQKALHRQG